MPRKAALKLVAIDEYPGDADQTAKRMTEWTEGQRRCRARRRHHWKHFHTIVHGTDPDRVGTRFHVVEQCPDCRNRRGTDFVRTVRGLRQIDDWVTEYREQHGVPYLLDKGSQRITDELREGLVAEIILGKQLTLIDDEDDL